MSFKPVVLEGGKDKQGQFICPFCGASFNFRYINEPDEGKTGQGISLEKHWATSPRCSSNRNTNNPTQSKYNVNEDD